MEGFLGEVGKKLTERWLTRVILPGLLFMLALAVAATPGRGHPIDIQQTIAWLERLRTAQYATPTGKVMALAIVLLGTAGTALLADWIRSGIVHLWAGRSRWLRRVAERTRTPVRQRATWIGGQFQEVEDRLWVQHHVVMGLAWPRLWQLAPESARQDVKDAWQRYTAAMLRTAWALPYLALGGWFCWWPALPIALILAVTGWHQGRNSVRVLCECIESTVDTGLNTLAASLGVQLPQGQVLPEEGDFIYELLNKGR